MQVHLLFFHKLPPTMKLTIYGSPHVYIWVVYNLKVWICHVAHSKNIKFEMNLASYFNCRQLSARGGSLPSKKSQQFTDKNQPVFVLFHRASLIWNCDSAALLAARHDLQKVSIGLRKTNFDNGKNGHNCLHF